MSRRWLAVLLSILLWSDAAIAAEPRATGPLGCVTPGLEPFDAAMTRLLQEWDVPGGSLAVSHNGRMLLVRGFGIANKSTGSPVTPRTKFRLGSMSKPITAVAILKLVEEGRLGLDDRILPLLGELAPPADAIRDPRVQAITVRHLLQHTGGFDRSVSRDPLFMPRAGDALKRQNANPPPTCRIVLRDALESQLDFEPGSRFAYSNLGYCILGRIIERIAGMPYVEFARLRILEPADASGLMLGRTLVTAADEATYYDYAGAPMRAAMPGVAEGMVPAPYGAFAVEEMDAYGGWVGAPIDYLRFILAIDGQREPRLLKEGSIREMLSRPNIPGTDPAQRFFYGLGMHVTITENNKNWWHAGYQPGFYALALRTALGHSWVSAFNSSPRDLTAFIRDLDTSLWAAAKRVGQWPASSENCTAYDPMH